jgi:hypothetical protein
MLLQVDSKKTKSDLIKKEANSRIVSDCPKSKEMLFQKVVLNNTEKEELKNVRSRWRAEDTAAQERKLFLEKIESDEQQCCLLSVITALESQISDIVLDINESKTLDRSKVSPNSPLLKSLKKLILSNKIEINNLIKHKVALEEENGRLLVENERLLIVEQSQALHRELGIPIAVEKNESQVAKGEIKLQTEPKKSSILKVFKKAINKSFMSGNQKRSDHTQQTKTHKIRID